MADARTVNFKGSPMQLDGPELRAGQPAPDFTLTGIDMKDVKLADTGAGVRIFSVVPSLDTPVCDAQTRRFNEEASSLGNAHVLTVSRDLPFAQKRWCGAAGVERVTTLSDYKDGNFGQSWGMMLNEWKMLARAVVVVDSNNQVSYVEMVPDISEHPNYEAALAAARAAA